MYEEAKTNESVCNIVQQNQTIIHSIYNLSNLDFRHEDFLEISAEHYLHYNGLKYQILFFFFHLENN